MARCLHCKINGQSKCRGLCKPCWDDKAVRVLYPASPGRRLSSPTDDPTEEQLLQTIAEQAANLPKWWPKPPQEHWITRGELHFRASEMPKPAVRIPTRARPIRKLGRY